MHPPSGIVGGDSLNIQITCSRNASALITTPGATRYYGSNELIAMQVQHIDVRGGSMEWLPQGTIFFDRCVAQQELHVNIDHNSKFIGWDINCFGRKAGNHLFASGSVTTSLRLFCKNIPLLHERLIINGATDIQRISGLRGNCVAGTMLVVAPALRPEEWLNLADKVLSDRCFTATLIDNVLVIRYLGDNTETARDVFVQIWHLLRPLVMQQAAVLPRIWST